MKLIPREHPFAWKKKGLLYEPQAPYTHGSHPCITHLDGDDFAIAFTRRDEMSRSHVFLCRAQVSDGEIRLVDEPSHALDPGAPCTFDCEGVISVCFVTWRGRTFLYYVGWQNLPEGLWICDTGRAEFDPVSFTLKKEFLGPVLGRDKDNPLFAAATAFHVTDDLWRTWYNSGIKWERTGTGWKHYYGVHHASSSDGITWKCDPGLVLPFADEYEYAFGRPSVLRHNDRYYMWFAHRATKEIDTYRIGFACSEDGFAWERNDRLSGIDVAPDGWDSEMVCYPCVFEHRRRWYMLYNGNGYGRTGFGYAVLEEDL